MTPLHLNPYTTESDCRRLVDELFADGSSSLVWRSTMLANDGSEAPVERSFHSATAGRDGRQSVISLARDIADRLAAEGLSLQSAVAGVGRFPPHLAGAIPTVTPAGMTDTAGRPVQRVLLCAG